MKWHVPLEKMAHEHNLGIDIGSDVNFLSYCSSVAGWSNRKNEYQDVQVRRGEPRTHNSSHDM